MKPDYETIRIEPTILQATLPPKFKKYEDDIYATNEKYKRLVFKEM